MYAHAVNVYTKGLELRLPLRGRLRPRGRAFLGYGVRGCGFLGRNARTSEGGDAFSYFSPVRVNTAKKLARDYYLLVWECKRERESRRLICDLTLSVKE